jgi:hypothetical protein
MNSTQRKTTVRRGFVLGLAVLVSAMLTTGCGGKKAVYPVHGVVLDGKNKPAKGTVLVFHPANGDTTSAAKPVGTVGDNGEFVLTTYQNGDGAPAGDYVVTIIRPTPKRTPLDREGGDLLRGRYADPAASKITFTVEKGADNEVPRIQLP